MAKAAVNALASFGIQCESEKAANMCRQGVFIAWMALIFFSSVSGQLCSRQL